MVQVDGSIKLTMLLIGLGVLVVALFIVGTSIYLYNTRLFTQKRKTIPYDAASSSSPISIHSVLNGI